MTLCGKNPIPAITGADVIDVIGKVCGRGVFEVVAA